MPAEELNEHETIIGIDEQSCPKPLRLFQAWNASMEKLDAQAAKFAQANMQHIAGDDGAHVAAQKVATKEFVRNSIAVDIIDIAKQMAKTSGARGESFRCDVRQLAACFRAMKAMIQTLAAVRRLAMSVVTLHIVARIVDYYITKCAAKPMEQLHKYGFQNGYLESTVPDYVFLASVKM